MLSAHQISKSFELQILFEDVNFSLSPGERMGLIGPNGCGKTTLVRILVGEEQADRGHVRRDPELRIGYLRQGFELDPGARFGEIIGRASGSAQALEDELAAAAKVLTDNPRDRQAQVRYDELLQRLEAAEVGRTAAILAGLGLDQVDPDLPAGRMSGGQQTRLALALVLIGEPQLLLLDEPTNHLDIGMLEWLEDWLAAYPGAALIVSHDRTFLDRSVNRILEIDPLLQRGRVYSGNYSDYLAQRQAEIEQQWASYRDQQSEIQRMRQDIARVKAQAAYTERRASSIRIGGPEMKIKGRKSYEQGIAKKVARKAKARERKLEHYLEADERVEKPGKAWQMNLEFSETAHLGRRAAWVEDLSIGYSLAAPLLTHLNLELRAGGRIVLTGPNGSGKTTLLRTIAGQIPALGGEVQVGTSTRLGYMTQDQSGLDPNRTAGETIGEYFANETEGRTFLANFLFTGDEPLKINSLLSYGQRARLMLAVLAAQGCNCLLLDEPVNHLDLPSRSQFEQALAGFQGAVLAVVHDRYFIERFADEIWWVEKGGVRRELLRT